MRRKMLTVLLTLLVLSACASAQTDAPARAVEAYLEAIVTGDADAAALVSCADWEETARSEVAAFAGVEARLEGAACTSRAGSGPITLVDCTGAIVATYNNEDADFPLEGRAYQTAEEGGEWHVCGYGE